MEFMVNANASEVLMEFMYKSLYYVFFSNYLRYRFGGEQKQTFAKAVVDILLELKVCVQKYKQKVRYMLGRFKRLRVTREPQIY